jgi:fructuronate reductase
MKLRLLNGAHSVLAYLGYLGGHETVAEASADPVLATLLEKLWAEIIPTVPAPPGVELDAYTRSLLARFRNRSIRHRTWQIAMDGSQKLPQRLLGTIRDRLAEGQSINTLALGVAGWMRYVMGVDEKFAAIDVKDPLASAFKSRVERAGGNPAAVVDGLLDIKAIFGDDLPKSAIFRRLLVSHLESFLQKGVLASLR